MIKYSSPGKLMLFGDHSVVHNHPCIVTAVNHRMSVEMEKTDDNKIILDAPDVNLNQYEINSTDLNKEHPKATRFVLTAVKNFFEKFNITAGLNIKTKSEFSSKFGFGSSSAATVSTMACLSDLFNIDMTKKEIFNLSYKTVIDIQEVGSGFDVAAATYGGTLYFVTGGKVIEELPAKELPILVGYTGIKADTSTIVKEVRNKLEKTPEKINDIFDSITKIVDQAKDHVISEDSESIGKLFNENQKLLRTLDVSSTELENLISASISAGAYGAKLSGAGGGDCMIAVTPENKTNAVKLSIEQAGGQIINVKTGEEGVRIEI